jgi:hypothetical protein
VFGNPFGMDPVPPGINPNVDHSQGLRSERQAPAGRFWRKHLPGIMGPVVTIALYLILERFVGSSWAAAITVLLLTSLIILLSGNHRRKTRAKAEAGEEDSAPSANGKGE